MRLFVLFLFGFLFTSNQGFGHPMNEKTFIDPTLLELFAQQDIVDCVITFDLKADVYPAKYLKTKEEKTHFVFQVLQKVRDKSQGNVLSYLDKNEVDYNSYYIVNVISAKLNKTQVLELAEYSEIKAIAHNPSVKKEKHFAENNNLTRELPEPEWGIKMIQADSVWRLGYEGDGVVVGGQDTGFEWEHSVLIDKYRGQSENGVDHNYNWHDAIREINGSNPDSINPCGLDSPVPCDDNNHGTHTMGTMIGSDSMNAIGVAPKAKWIACRNMERGYGTPSTYIECFEWFLAPTNLDGEFPDPSLAPDVINNSWSCPESEGCNDTNWEMMEDAIINLKAAGVVVIVSAGNEGRDGCGTIARPPAMFESSFAVGATRANDTIAAFSSRGPVVIDSSFRLKPDVSAPGHNVRSAIRNGEFRSFSGTSMAGPHVVGAVALILNANPNLRGQVEVIEDILINMAEVKFDDTDCFDILGQESPNHVYGAGRINVLHAVEFAQSISSVKEENPNTLSFKIYPNPAFDVINIDASSMQLSDYRLSLYNAEGKLIKVKSNAPKTLTLNGIPNGLYIVKLDSKEGTAFERLVISN